MTDVYRPWVRDESPHYVAMCRQYQWPSDPEALISEYETLRGLGYRPVGVTAGHIICEKPEAA